MAKNFLGVDPDIPNYGAAKRAGPIRMIQDWQYQPIQDAENQIAAGIGVGAAQVFPVEDPLSYYNLIQEKLVNDQAQREKLVAEQKEALNIEWGDEKPLLPDQRKWANKEKQRIREAYIKAYKDGSIKNPLVSEQLKSMVDVYKGTLNDFSGQAKEYYAAQRAVTTNPDKFGLKSPSLLSDVPTSIYSDDPYEISSNLSRGVSDAVYAKRDTDYIKYFRDRTKSVTNRIKEEFGEVTTTNVKPLRDAIKKQVENDYAFMEDTNPYMTSQILDEYGTRDQAIEAMTRDSMARVNIVKERVEDEEKKSSDKKYGTGISEEDVLLRKEVIKRIQNQDRSAFEQIIGSKFLGGKVSDIDYKNEGDDTFLVVSYGKEDQYGRTDTKTKEYKISGKSGSFGIINTMLNEVAGQMKISIEALQKAPEATTGDLSYDELNKDISSIQNIESNEKEARKALSKINASEIKFTPYKEKGRESILSFKYNGKEYSFNLNDEKSYSDLKNFIMENESSKYMKGGAVEDAINPVTKAKNKAKEENKINTISKATLNRNVEKARKDYKERTGEDLSYEDALIKVEKIMELNGITLEE